VSFACVLMHALACLSFLFFPQIGIEVQLAWMAPVLDAESLAKRLRLHLFRVPPPRAFSAAQVEVGARIRPCAGGLCLLLLCCQPLPTRSRVRSACFSHTMALSASSSAFPSPFARRFGF
jgi:hypothetical protein